MIDLDYWEDEVGDSLDCFVYSGSENDAVNRFFETRPDIELLLSGDADAYVNDGVIPDPWDMTEEERDEFVNEAYYTFVYSLEFDGQTLIDTIGAAFANALRNAMDRRLRDGIADDGTMHLTPSKYD